MASCPPPTSPISEKESRSEDPKGLATHRLVMGVIASKHTTKGKKERWIRMSLDHQRIEWWSQNKSKKRGEIYVEDIVALANGWQTNVFMQASKTMDRIAEGRCFSFVCADKTLDLELKSKSARDRWSRDVAIVTGLSQLVISPRKNNL